MLKKITLAQIDIMQLQAVPTFDDIEAEVFKKQFYEPQLPAVR